MSHSFSFIETFYRIPETNTTLAFNREQLLVIRSIYITSALLSVLGSVFILLSLMVARKAQTLVLRLVCCLAVTDLCYAIAALLVIGLPDNPQDMTESQIILCEIQGSGIQFFQLSSFLWTACIAWHAYVAFVKKATKADLQSYFKIYAVIAWVVPIIPLSYLLAKNIIGMDSGWCWIPQDYGSLRMYLFWGPVFCIWIFDCVCYYAVRKKLREMLSFLEKAASRRILGYILIYILVAIPPLTNRITEFFVKPNFVLFCIHSAFDPLIGFCNAIVYGWNKQLRTAIQSKLCGAVEFGPVQVGLRNPPEEGRTKYQSTENVTKNTEEEHEHPDY